VKEKESLLDFYFNPFSDNNDASFMFSETVDVTPPPPTTTTTATTTTRRPQPPPPAPVPCNDCINLHIFHIFAAYDVSYPCADYKPGEDDLQNFDFIRKFELDVSLEGVKSHFFAVK